MWLDRVADQRINESGSAFHQAYILTVAPEIHLIDTFTQFVRDTAPQQSKSASAGRPKPATNSLRKKFVRNEDAAVYLFHKVAGLFAAGG